MAILVNDNIFEKKGLPLGFKIGLPLGYVKILLKVKFFFLFFSVEYPVSCKVFFILI